MIKIMCYAFHLFFSRKRFTLPRQSPPLFKGNEKSIIPRVLWQTNFTDRVSLPVYINYLFNRLMSPTYAYRFMGTEDIVEFIESNYSKKIFESYSKLQIGAAQADFWRVLVLQKYGGVYLDVDAHLMWPLERTIDRRYEALYLINKKGRITNYFIASKQDSDHLYGIIKAIMTNIEENVLTSVYRLTGPGVFSQVLNEKEVKTVSYRYTCNQGNFTNEYFQYIDKPRGKWTKAQMEMDIVKR